MSTRHTASVVVLPAALMPVPEAKRASRGVWAQAGRSLLLVMFCFCVEGAAISLYFRRCMPPMSVRVPPPRLLRHSQTPWLLHALERALRQRM